jgi:hypothetical protein
LRPVLVFIVALAGVVDGGLLLGAPLATSLVQSRPLIGYLATSLLLVGAALGAAPAATMAANVVIRTSRGRYLPVLAVTAIAGVALAVAQTWVVQHLLYEPSRTPLLLASVILIALVATAGATVIRIPVSGRGRRRSAVMIGVVVVIVIVAVFLLLAALALASAFSNIG